MSLTIILVIVVIAALAIILGAAFFYRSRSPRANPVHNDATSRYPAAETQMQPGYDPDGLVDSPDEYGPRHRPSGWFGRRRMNSR
jgi:flagellar basal body-associated protein FliL